MKRKLSNEKIIEEILMPKNYEKYFTQDLNLQNNNNPTLSLENIKISSLSEETVRLLK